MSYLVVVAACFDTPFWAHSWAHTIHGFEDADVVHALVMELVEGPTLADRIVSGAMSINEALAIASQIADALEAAHEQGIIHRVPISC